MLKNSKFKCTACGDAMITRRLPADGEYAGFSEVRDFILQGDFRFSNLETTVHNYESFASARSGGSWLCSPPGVVHDMRKFGINILTTANNHALDYSYGGLERTLHYIKEAGFPCCGTGMNLADAARPAYLDTANGRYALIGCTMTYNPEDMAGEQTKNLPGRPGVNVMRVNKKYLLPNELLGKLKEIADALNINNYDNIIRAEGYLPQLNDGEQQFGPLFFEAGEKAEIIPSIHPDDMQRMLDAIAEARFMADYIVISMHSHELSGNSKEDVDVISREFAHSCIEAGADAVIGTGPHLLRGMEIYKEKPIFYGLGDFIIQLETFERAPADMFAKQKLNGNGRLDVLFNKRSGNGKRGLCYDPIMYKSVIPYWEVEAGKIVKMTFMPIEEQFCNSRGSAGFPQKNCELGIMEHFADLSGKFGTSIRIENGLGVLEL